MSSLPATQPGGKPSASVPAKKDPARTIYALLERQKDQIKLALPKHLDADRMVRIVFTVVRQNPDLLKCDEASLLKCVMQCSSLGLEPDPLLGRAYLVPFYNTKAGRHECTLIIGYKGFIDLARRSGEIESLEAHVVYQADDWDYSYGLTPVLYHKPSNRADCGGVVAAWALARFKGGGYQFEVMSHAELEAVRKLSKQGGGNIWTTHTAEMYRKTVIRRLAKLLPLSPALVRHVAYEEAVEAGADAPSDYYGEPVEDAALPPPEAPADESSKVLAKMSGKPEPREPGQEG